MEPKGSKFDYNRLQEGICKGMGFCGGLVDGEPAHVDDFIPEHGKVTVDQFISWLFQAENYYHERDPKFSPHYKDLKRIFIETMGSDCVDASRLKWDV